MAKKQPRVVRHHSLIIYRRLGQRLRIAPIFIVLFSLILYGLGWLADNGILQEGNMALLQSLWAGRALILVLIVACVGLVVITVIISRFSNVEVRRKALRVQAGLVALDISYKRIRQIRLSQLGALYPEDKMSGADWSLAEPFMGAPCTILDLSGWPWPGLKNLRHLWSKFMFTPDGNSLLLVCKDAMVLNQQIDAQIAARRGKQQSAYLDPIDRAAAASQSGRQRR